MADGKKCVKARLAAKGFQGPDLKEGLVGTSGCVSLRSPHLQVASLSAIRQWKLWSLDIKNAFLRAPMEWDPACTSRASKLKAPAYGLDDAWWPSIVL